MLCNANFVAGLNTNLRLCRVFMAKVVLHWMGTDALFVSEPVAWLGALLCVLIPYFYYRNKLLKSDK